MRLRIQTLTVIMVLAILGVVGLQAYWLQRSWQANKERFERDARTALEMAVRDRLAERFRDQFGRRGVRPMFFSDSQAIVLDSGMVHHEIIEERWMGTPAHPFHHDGLREYNLSQDTTIIIARTEFISDCTAQHPQLHNGQFPFLRLDVGDSVEGILDSMALRLRGSGAASGLRIEISADSSFNMLVEGAIAQVLSSAIDLEAIDSVFQEQLKAKKLPNDYRLEVRYPGGELDILNPELEAKGISTGSVKVRGAFPAEMEAWFPNPRGELLAALIGPMVLSLLLCLVVAAALVYMLRTIYRQKQLSEITSDFINNMTHELKTPIATVTAALEALEHFDGIADPQRRSRYLDMAGQELERLTTMVDRILYTAAYEKKGIQLNRELLSVKEIAERLLEKYRVRYGASATFSLDAQSEAIARIDRLHFTNMLNNLVENAVKYSGADAVVQVRIRESSEGLLLEVQDNGPGIPKAARGRLFDPFYRVPMGDRHDVKGFGLGLSYVRKVVDAHGWNISVDSANPGSIFSVRMHTGEPEAESDLGLNRDPSSSIG